MDCTRLLRTKPEWTYGKTRWLDTWLVAAQGRIRCCSHFFERGFPYQAPGWEHQPQFYVNHLGVHISSGTVFSLTFTWKIESEPDKKPLIRTEDQDDPEQLPTGRSESIKPWEEATTSGVIHVETRCFIQLVPAQKLILGEFRPPHVWHTLTVSAE